MVNLAKISIARDSHQANEMDTLPPIHNVAQNDAPDPGRRLEHAADTRRGKKRSLGHDEDPKRQEREVVRPVEPEGDAKWCSQLHSCRRIHKPTRAQGLLCCQTGIHILIAVARRLANGT